MHEDNDVPNRYMTWWKRACWMRIDDGSSMRGRRRVWRAARRAAEQARDDDGVEETQRQADEAQGEKWESGKKEKQTRSRSENTLHIVLHLPSNAIATATTAAATAAAAAPPVVTMESAQTSAYHLLASAIQIPHSLSRNQNEVSQSVSRNENIDVCSVWPQHGRLSRDCGVTHSRSSLASPSNL